MNAVTDSHTVLWVPRYWPAVGGTEFHSHELAQYLSHDHRVSVLVHCTDTETPTEPLSVSAALTPASDTLDGTVRTVTLATPQPYVGILSRLGRWQSHSKIARKLYQLFFNLAFKESAGALLADADRVHFIYNGLTEAAALAAQLCAQQQIPFVFTPNALDTSDTGSDWASPSFKHLYKQADRLIALTQHEARWLMAQGAAAEKISVVPYGPILRARDSAQEQGDMASLLASRYVLFLGRLIPEKGFLPLIAAFERLAVDDWETQLVLVGPADASTQAQIERANRQYDRPRVRLILEVSQPLKTALIEQAAVLCLPSRQESLGGVYIEAMACGIPVIALDRPVSHCVIDDQKDGLLVANHAAAIADGMRTVLENPELARQLGIAGQAKVSRRFAWPVVINQILDVYSQLSQRSLD